MTNCFADFLTSVSIKNQSVLCAGLDPVIHNFPKTFVESAKKSSHSNDEFHENAIFSFYEFCLNRISSEVACIKPNIAFFEQYGIGGLKALQKVLRLSAMLNIPSILDCKRGDIGSTAEAYVNAYLPKDSPFEADAITVNAFLGFDTAQTFLNGAIAAGGKGLFYLVKTSNPGSADLQDLKANGMTVSEHIAAWIDKNTEKLTGDLADVSGLGAVVGATHPDHLKALRTLMPKALFLIPGYGAQGGKAEDLKAGFIKPADGSKNAIGAIVNASRGIFNAFSSNDLSLDQTEKELAGIVKTLKIDLQTCSAQ